MILFNPRFRSSNFKFELLDNVNDNSIFDELIPFVDNLMTFWLLNKGKFS